MTAVFSLDADWQPATAASLPAKLAPWLLEPASLTARLKAHFTQFQLDVLAEQPQTLPVYLAPSLGLLAHSLCVQREVLMWGNALPVVYAQSWLPQSSQQQIHQLQQVGQQPLGELLFQFTNLQRSTIEVAQLRLAEPTALIDAGEYWARRSVFYIDTAPLLVAEIFLAAWDKL